MKSLRWRYLGWIAGGVVGLWSSTQVSLGESFASASPTEPPPSSLAEDEQPPQATIEYGEQQPASDNEGEREPPPALESGDMGNPPLAEEEEVPKLEISGGLIPDESSGVEEPPKEAIGDDGAPGGWL